MLKPTLKVWRSVIRENKLEDINILSWCAYDSDFRPNKMDDRFKVWTVKSITFLCTVTQKIILFYNIILFYKIICFQMLKCLQIWHCYNYKMQNKDNQGILQTYGANFLLLHINQI